jgi:hypothetical protein
MTTPANNNPGNTQSQQQQRPNPFASRLGGTAQRPAGNQPAPNAAPPFGGSLLRRTNPNEILWSVSPIYGAFVRFQLAGLGDPFHRLLGMPLNMDYGNPAKVIAALQQETDLREKLEMLLDQTWATYAFKGAAIMYPWEDEVRKAITQPPQPVYVPPANNNANNDDDNDDNGDSQEWLTNPKPVRPPETLRAIDLLLVLNVLARVRSNILVTNTPLALEPGFLDQTFISDDPRIVAMARATGSIEEAW